MNWLKKIIEEQDTTVYKFAQRCDIGKDIFYKIINRDSGVENISVSTMDGIAKGLDMTISEFLDKYVNKKRG